MSFECSKEKLALLREFSQVVGDAYSTKDQKVDAFNKLFTLYYSLKEKSITTGVEEGDARRAKVDKLVFKLQSDYQHLSILIGDFAKNVTELHDSLEKREIDSALKTPLFGQLYDSFDLFVQEIFQV